MFIKAHSLADGCEYEYRTGRRGEDTLDVKLPALGCVVEVRRADGEKRYFHCGFDSPRDALIMARLLPWHCLVRAEELD
ncbi:MAG: hypothetical protein II124_05375 [Clostridia bacterium]|nr:hypothetical protein [Clostridia bacterium]MBQ2517698.1 hypothetical protein [Clostridia bacterium]MBQ4341063.1 hypothetical protein [Clostridia bacterium]MBR6428827.1 hypothetical protein [Clostridia bacterium]